MVASASFPRRGVPLGGDEGSGRRHPPGQALAGTPVGVEDVVPIEDRKRVEPDPEYRAEVDLAREAVVDAHGRLEHAPEAQASGDDEELEVEGVALLEHPGENRREDVPADELEAGLRVPHADAEEHASEHVVAPAQEPSQRRVVHLGERVALRAEHDVGLVQLHEREEGLDRVGFDVAVGVAERHVLPSGLGETDLERMALPLADRVGDHPHGARRRATRRSRRSRRCCRRRRR